ncbi:fungal protein [Schizosaccharomyces japonicus yFS275]|uniref:Fungal protein n=1 Tax=Schizosaccharomyces japonicus (strain yFS275 / FY16936) TaxID=402676 RepID=B6JX33_SCHJY|nr:fungal protein [Schizosaccharomyces japonicus yFS275]EEB05934.1 fungal protein [Schizosaccharomyces japonicus yFS275]
MSDPSHVIAGHKAALHNPNVSEESKHRQEEWLSSHHQTDQTKSKGRSRYPTDGPLRTTEMGDNEDLEDEDFGDDNVMGDAPRGGEDLVDDYYAKGKNLGNVRGGFKASLKNPNVSQQTKQHSKEMLDEIDDEVNGR